MVNFEYFWNRVLAWAAEEAILNGQYPHYMRLVRRFFSYTRP